MSLFSNIEASQDRYTQSLASRNLHLPPLTSGFDQRLGEAAYDENCPPGGDTYSTGSQGYMSTFSNDRRILGPSNSFESPLMTTPTTPAHQMIHHSRGQSIGNNSSFDLGNESGTTSSFLGRRKRPDSLADWSPPTKAYLRAYAKEVASEYAVPEDSQDEFINASMLPTHKLVVITLAAVLGRQADDSSTSKLQTYLASSEFKDNVTVQVRCILLDPKLPSYKIGFFDRLMRHIRLNPAAYHIPHEFRGMITTRLFGSAISRAATTARADIKRKMASGWNVKASIYELVKTLAYKSSQEMTRSGDQMKLVDYKTQAGKDDGAWDWVDQQLAKEREKVLMVPLEERAAFTSFVFEEALKSHLQLCKPKKGKNKSSTRIPKWQEDISRAVAEMESYTVEDLAGEETIEEEEEQAGAPPALASG
ncbi:hypothetical protein B0H14DRAFT_2616532 [Mycena olivaceomarginata]|nr:hypothetical protein B0H14DRAFT_2616532 [Mycena olivaceomarginata]